MKCEDYEVGDVVKFNFGISNEYVCKVKIIDKSSEGYRVKFLEYPKLSGISQGYSDEFFDIHNAVKLEDN